MLRSGDWLHNVKTGELARCAVAPADTGGARLVADLWLQPSAAVFSEHIHDHLEETFTVHEGEVEFILDGVRSTGGPGTQVNIPVGTAHDWRNAGDAEAHVVVEVKAVPGSGPMAARFAEAIEAAFGLANSGRTNAKGMPTPLWLASLVHSYRDVLRVTKPPQALQRAIFGPLSALARLTGRDATAAWLHGDGSPSRCDQPRRNLVAAADRAAGETTKPASPSGNEVTPV